MNPKNQPPQTTHNQAVEAVSRAMTRFPMIVGILDELGKAEIPMPGDDDIRHGCQRAITAMMVELARIKPASAGKTTKAEGPLNDWIHSKDASRLINADQLQRIHQFIERILGTQQHQHH
jgi:hypothetical protein